MANETDLTKRILLKISKGKGVKIFRNNVGKCWIGASKKFSSPQAVLVKAGDVLIQNARYFDAGLHPGSSDLIGWKTVEITPEMVGSKLAIFTAVEVKMPNGRIQEHQQNFLKILREDGGIGVICRNENDLDLNFK